MQLGKLAVKMEGSDRKFYISSPVFTREDEERYHYVATEVEGMTTRWNDDDVELKSLTNSDVGPRVSVGGDRSQPAQKALYQSGRDSVLRDSLEVDYSDSDAACKKSGIVVNDRSRYEDLTMEAGDRQAVSHHASTTGRPDVVPKYGSSNAKSRHYYLHDDAEEYEETQIERQQQRQKARRAHVPQLELSHSDDELADKANEFDLEINDGQSSHGNHHYSFQNNAGHGNQYHADFRSMPHNSNSANHGQLMDSLEVAKYYPNNGGNGGNPDYERNLYVNSRTFSKHEAHTQYDPAGSQLLHHNVLMQDPNYQAYESLQNSSAKKQQLSNCTRNSSETHPHGQTSQTSNFRKKLDENSAATDFVEANRHNVNRKPQRTYGQIHSQKKVTEDAMDYKRSPQQRPVDSVPSVSAPSREKAGAVQALSEQNSVPPSERSEKSNVPNAEQLWKARSQSLAARKESAQSSGKNRHGRAVQNKVVRDVHVNGTHPVVPQGSSSSAPYEHHPNVLQFSTGSFTVPVQPDMPRSLPQKVSVDINLNVVSPRPLLNQPSASLPIQYTSSPPQDVYLHSPQSQVHTSPAGHCHYPAAPQPLPPSFSMSQPFATTMPSAAATNAVQYPSNVDQLSSYQVLPHSYPTPVFVSNGYQQPMPHFFDSQGQVIPNQVMPQHLPIRYNYSYPQQLPVPTDDAQNHLVHPYQMEVCFIKF